MYAAFACECCCTSESQPNLKRGHRAIVVLLLQDMRRHASALPIRGPPVLSGGKEIVEQMLIEECLGMYGHWIVEVEGFMTVRSFAMLTEELLEECEVSRAHTGRIHFANCVPVSCCCKSRANYVTARVWYEQPPMKVGHKLRLLSIISAIQDSARADE
jgi:hypothetical protein